MSSTETSAEPQPGGADPSVQVEAPPDDVPDDVAAAAAVDSLLSETIDAINPTPDEGDPTSDEGDPTPDVGDPTPDDSTTEPPDLSKVATDSVLGELEATRAEFEEMGWTQIGTPSIVSVEVVTSQVQAPQSEFVVEVCLDNSSVRIVDVDGNDLRRDATPSRSLNIYTFRWIEGRWLPAEHTFPNDPTC